MENVEVTIEEIAKEKREKEQEKKRQSGFVRGLLMTLKCLFFPVTLSVMGIKKLTYKIKLSITVKLTIAYSLVFILLFIGFNMFYLYSVENHLKAGTAVDHEKFIFNLKIVSGFLIAIFIAVFVALVVVVSRLMLNPVQKMTEEIDAITSEDLSKRLAVPDTQDELMELTERINEMLDNIDESFKRQKNFVSDASHELKTPVAVIQGYSNLLSRWGKSDPEILQEAIFSISRESENMKRIIDQLLLLARLGKMSMNKTRFNLYEILDDVVDGYKMLHTEHKMVFIGDEEIILDTDKNLLIECVRTLVDNAVKYSPDGGTVAVECFMDGEAAKITVQDTGIGISEEDLPKIFDRFFRCDKARGREKGSSGLGLTIAKSIVDMMRGDITVTSKLGEGTMFTITLY